MSAAVTVVLALLIAVVLVPLIRRDLRAAAARQRARRYWVERLPYIQARVAATKRPDLPSEEFAREHLDWWSDESAAR